MQPPETTADLVEQRLSEREVDYQRQVATALEDVRRRVLVDIAGPTAEEILTGEWNAVGAASDMESLAEILERTWGELDEDLAPPFVDWAIDLAVVVDHARELWGDNTRCHLKQAWPWVEAVAQAALDGDRTLTGGQIDALRPAHTT